MSAPLCLLPPVSFPVLPSTAPPGLALRTDVWSAQSLGHADAPVVSTGHAALDAQLPGGGWPVGALVEILQAPSGGQVWSLLLPALVQVLARQPGPVVLVGSPAAPGASSGLADGLVPFGPSLRAQGLAPERLLWVCAGPSPAKMAPMAARLWATEQALRCADVAAVLAWLPQADSSALRRLQLAAQMHGRLLFVCRPQTAQHQASPARLRLLVEATSAAPGRSQASSAPPGGSAVHEVTSVGAILQVRILKRRGPPLDTPLRLAVQPARLTALLAARRQGQGAGVAQAAPVRPVVPQGPPRRGVGRDPARRRTVEGSHALDRVAVAAG